MTQLSSGWLPAEISLDRHPALIQEATVRWLEFGSTPLDDPFLRQTVAKLREASPPTREMQTDGDGLLRLCSRLPQVRPAGFIFHISHCGSTLVANSLRTLPGTQVVSESRPASSLVRPCAPVSPFLDSLWHKTRCSLLEGLLSLYSHYPDGNTKPLILKLASIDTMGIALVRQCWPDVPFLFIVRDPVEIMVSLTSSNGGWTGLKSDPALACEVFGWEHVSVEDMSADEYSARVLGTFLETALQSLTGPIEVVDYEDLNPRRIGRIAEFFGLDLPQQEPALAQVNRIYSKDPTRTKGFEDDRTRKQQAATPELRSAARQWAMPHYNRIRAR